MTEIGGTNGRIEWIAKAKGFAILGVVAVHTIQRFTLPDKLSSIAYAGMYGVQLFFVVSAYLTFLSLEKHTTCWTVKGYLKYYGHKIVRLVPVLYTAVLWHVLMGLPIFHGHALENNPTIWTDAFYAVTFLNGFSIHHVNPWANWYIGVLVIFLAIAPLLYSWINTFKKSVLFFIVAMFVAWIGSMVIAKSSVDMYWYFYFPAQLPVLAIGIMFYHIKKSSRVVPKSSLLTLGFVVSACMLLSLFYFTSPMERHVEFGLLLLVFAYTLFNNSGKWFNWLKVLGDYSYGIYLYHFCLLVIFDYVVNKFGVSQNSMVSFVCYYILLVVISLLIAKIANLLVERPFFRMVRK